MPTLPKPCTATLIFLGLILAFFKYSRKTIAPPSEVEYSLPRLPPSSSGFPVITAGDFDPTVFSYSSSIHAIVCELVLTSGAGISFPGPINGANSLMYALEILSSSG